MAKGATWRIASSGLRFLSQLLVAVILAHILSPRDLGLMSLAVIVAALASTCSDLGIGSALVQRSNLTHPHIQVGFTLSLITGSLATVIMWVVAPSVAVFFRSPDLTPVLRLVALCPFFDGLGVVSGSLLLRQLDFKRQFWADACGNLVGYAAVSIGLALLGYGVWGLAIGVVARASVFSATLLFMAPPTGGLLLARRETSEILDFGFGVNLTGLARYVASNADYFVVGTWLGTEALGFYQYAYQLAYFPITFVTAELSFVLFPLLAAIRHEPQKFQSVYRRALVLVSVIVLPSSVAIAISAPELVPTILGDRWVGSVLPLQILCIGGVFRAVYNLSGSLTKAAGAVYQQAVRYIVYALAVFGGSMVGLAWGVTGVSIGVVAAVVLVSILMSQLSIHLLKGTWLWFLKMHLPALLVALAVGAGGGLGSAIGWMLEQSHPVRLVLILLGCAGGALGGVVGIPARWLWSDATGLLTELTHLIPHKKIHGWLLWKVGERGTATSAERWLGGMTRSWVWRRIPIVGRTYREVRLLRHMIRQGLWGAFWSSWWRKSLCVQQQRVLTWDVRMPPVSSSLDLENWLRQQGIRTYSGGNTIYLPPQERLGAILGDWVDRYPPDAGVKILRDLRPPEQAFYQWAFCCGRVEKALVGTPADQLLTANFLYANGLSPRVYDLCCLRSGSARFTAFVVQHIAGLAPGEVDAQKFLSRLTKVLDNTDLKTVHPDWNETSDFMPPTFHGNLLVRQDTSEPLYVDFQPFRLCDTVRWRREILNAGARVLHCGDGRPSGDGRSLCQSVPGGAKNGNCDGTKRGAIILDQLKRQGLEVKGRLVLDVGCNAGMMIAAALNEGALWGMGWDLPSVVTYAESFLLSAGLTRFNLIAAELDRTYPLHEDIPDHLRPCLTESVLFFLSAWQHVDLMDSLYQLPWRVFVYAGQQRERLEDLDEQIGPLLRHNIRIASRTYIGDGFSDRRLLAILLKT